MNLKKNWFYILFVLLAGMGMIYVFIYSFVSLGEETEYGYFIRGGLLLVLFGIWGGVHVLSTLFYREGLEKGLSRSRKWVKWAEVGLVCVILVLSAVLKARILSQMPETYLQEYKSYYEIAQALKDSSIQQYADRYSGIITEKPTMMGYSYLLMLMFKLWGGVRAGQYLNIFLSTASVFFAYKIARKAGGRLAGFTALVLCAFWPSRLVSSAVLSSESVFVCLALLCIWIFLSLLTDYDAETASAVKAVCLYLLLGVIFALASAVSAVSVILLLIMLLVLLPQKMELPAKPLNDIPLMVRAVRWGWMRCLMILLPYILLTVVFSSNIELTIDENIPAMELTLGSSLWEEIGDSLSSDNSIRDPKTLAEHLESLFVNENYGLEQSRALLEEQGMYFGERKTLLTQLGSLNQIAYVGTIFFAVIGFLYLLYKRANSTFLLPLLFLGMAVVTLLSGTETEYAFFVPQLFMLSASVAIGYISLEGCRQTREKQMEKRLLQREREVKAYKLKQKEQEEERLTELRKEAYANLFDMEKALKEGHVIMTVSKAYEETALEQEQEKPQPAQAWENEPIEDDYDWKYTEEDLNIFAEDDWAFVRSAGSKTPRGDRR